MEVRKWRAWLAVGVLCLMASSIRAQDISFGNLPALQVATPVPGSSHVPGDINGDGLSDLLWFNPTTHQLAYWLMATDIGSVTRIGSKTYTIAPGYYVAATGDFNGDGLMDIIFTSARHDLYLWTNDGHGGFTSRFLYDYPAGWLPVGAGDLDGDGQDDLLWLNPGKCQFGEWIMKNGVHTASKIVNIACGYYPLSIGYYTPTNRLSIVWTSAAKDLYVWDSEPGTPNNFVSHALGMYASGNYVLAAFGGGFEGSGMGLMTYTTDVFGSSSGEGEALSRTFDSSLMQSGYTRTGIWIGGVVAPWSSAGFLIEGKGLNLTGVIYQEGPEKIEICPPQGDPHLTQDGPAPIQRECIAFSFPQGWYVVGAMANGVVPSP